ncbi:MAG: tail fiber protein [Methylococcaceae bacterium]
MPHLKPLTILPLTIFLISPQARAADPSPCSGLLSLGLYNTTQRTDDTQARSLLVSDFCSRDFSQINDSDFDSNSQAQLIRASYNALTGSFPTLNTDIRNSIQNKQKELCTAYGYGSSEYLKNTSDTAKNMYQSALKSWGECNDLNTSSLQFKANPSRVPQSITVDLSTRATNNGLALTGVNQSGGKALCTTTLPPKNASSRNANVITVDNSTYIAFNTPATVSISCNRDMVDDGMGGKYAEETDMEFKTTVGSVRFSMAAIGKVPRVDYDKAVADVKNLADTKISIISDSVQNMNKLISGNTDLTTIIQNSTLPLLLRVVPAGTIMAYWSKTIPEGWLLCDGSKIPDGAVYDSLRKVVGANIPDLRGTFLRGAGQNSNTALQYSGDSTREISQVQLDTFKSHSHSFDDYTYSEIKGIFGNGGRYGAHAGDDYDNSPASPWNHDTYTTGDGETRPKNISVNWIIKY